MTIVRALLLSAAALAVGLVAVRSAAGDARPDSPVAAARPWFAGQSDIAAERAMVAIAEAARNRQPMPATVAASLEDLARAAPLRTEPFLAAGAQAVADGDSRRAEALFLAARTRDPRSIAARYFLAEQSLRTGKIETGLAELAALGRLDPRFAEPLAPAIVAFLGQPGALPRVRTYFARDPASRDRVLNLLAADPANAGSVLALAPSLPMPRDAPAPAWQGIVVTKLVEAGRNAEAERAWSRLSGLRRSALVNDPAFGRLSAPAPFGWTVIESPGGVAQVGGRGLDLVHYGRQQAIYAQQLLALSPGTYRVGSTLAAGTASPTVRVIVHCLDGREIASVAVGATAPMIVPAGCAGPMLKVGGNVAESPETVELTVGSVRVERAS